MTFWKGARLTIVGGFFCGAVTAVVFWALGVLFWLPYWRYIRDAGFYVHDIDWTYLVWFAPVLFGPLYAILTAVLIITGKWDSRWIAILTLGVVPTLLIVGSEFLPGGPKGYYFPGKEIGVLAAGVLWSFLLPRLAKSNPPVGAKSPFSNKSL